MRVVSFDIGIKNLAFCDVSRIQRDTNDCVSYMIHDWQVLDISIGEKKHDINRVIEIILAKLDVLFSSELGLYDAILIENQPVLKNPVMKSIQMIIFTYFHVLRQNRQIRQKMKQGDEENTDSSSSFRTSLFSIHLISASNKCKTIRQLSNERAKEIEENTEMKAKAKKGYKFNKKMAHNLTMAFLDSRIVNKEEMFHAYETYQTHKKKDDLADSFLQAAYFLGQHK